MDKLEDPPKLMHFRGKTRLQTLCLSNKPQSEILSIAQTKVNVNKKSIGELHRYRLYRLLKQGLNLPTVKRPAFSEWVSEKQRTHVCGVNSCSSALLFRSIAPFQTLSCSQSSQVSPIGFHGLKVRRFISRCRHVKN